MSPDEAADAFLAQIRSSTGEDELPRGGAGKLDQDTLAALLDEKLSRREVKDIQSGYKDADRFEKWVAVLQERAPYEDPIVLPAGEGLNIVRRRSDGQLIYRCDCGHDFCAHNRNWKMDAVVYVRDSEEALLEIYPKMAGPDPKLQQIREYYCPSCARQLEVEALQPGYPGGSRVPAGRGGLLPRLAGARGPAVTQTRERARSARRLRETGLRAATN